ncbi:MAG: flagellar biosynthetic protein FliR [Lachnospiraceae bacterium]|nr:flagellar biosynthetic protein FliR [Lachnospiraceae bacterium]
MVDLSFTLFTFEHFLLILVRVTAFVAVAPFFSTRNVPRMAKVGLSALISILLMNVVDFSGIPYYDTSIGYGVLVVKEVCVGLFIGFGANVCNYIVLFAGNQIDTHMGLAMATEYDPQNGVQSTLTSTFYNYVLLLLLIVSDMYQFILRAFVDSYQVVPIAGAVFNWDSLMASFVSFIIQLFSIAFRITLPIFSCIMILNCVLGIMARVAPQMNMFAIGIQIKVLTGYVLLFLTIVLIPKMAEMVFTEMRIMIVSMIEGMMP